MTSLRYGKTEFLVIGKKSVTNKLSNVSSINIGGTYVKSVQSARNIGAVLDAELSMSQHINSVVRSCYCHLRQIAHIRPHLTNEAAATLINCLITSRLDFMNSLLHGIPSNLVRKLELIQNNAARVVCQKKKRDHVTPLLKALHWLPIDFRIQFKINLITFKAIHGLAPAYLASLIIPYVPSRTLRSSSQGQLVEKKARCKRTGDRAFSVCAPKLWNALPQNIRESANVKCFKTALKTFYFRLAFTE